METNKITAEEFCKSFNPTGKTWQENFHQTMIEFAKIKGAEILQAAAEKAKIDCIDYCNYRIDKQSILNSYDLNQIK